MNIHPLPVNRPIITRWLRQVGKFIPGRKLSIEYTEESSGISKSARERDALSLIFNPKLCV